MRWMIVGAGVLGMRLADVLSKEGHSVVLCEQGDALGGMASAWQLGDVRWDRHYHVTLMSDLRTRAMYESVGLADDVVWTETQTGYYGPDEVLRSVSSPVEFLKLPTLSLVDKVRLGATLAYASIIPDGRRLEKIGVDDWLRRWSGRSAFENFWQPLLRAKMSNAHRRASAAFIWATTRRLSAARRNGLDEERFGYVPGGYGRVCDAFEATFAERGVEVRTTTRVDSIVGADGSTAPGDTGPGVEVTTTSADGTQVTEHFDRAVVTTSAAIAARLCPTLLPRERARLEQVEYVGIVCVSLLLPRPLAEYYLTYITDSNTPFTAVVEMTAFIDPAEVGGHTLVYLPKYTDASDPLHDAPDDEVVDGFLAYLDRMYPAFDRSEVITSRVSRVRDVFAIPTLGYSDRGPSISTSIPGLSIAGSANLPFSTLNVDDTLSLVDDILRNAGLPTHHKDLVTT